MDSPFSTLSKQPWTPSEDQRLLKAVKSLGMDWGAVASVLVERSPQQCHRRCMALKFEGTKRGNWTADEDALILELTTHFGNRWIAIAQYIPGRFFVFCDLETSFSFSFILILLPQKRECGQKQISWNTQRFRSRFRYKS
eukprot:c6402_g1_i3.p1 GENE.c6402_g1_i3~~c6402_g1_i3.p1  ORF type:complete len:140 (-),score=21.57 c6402_g1_i3:379-798(-)